MKKLALTFYLGVSLIWGQAASPTSVHNRQAFSLQSARTVLDQYNLSPATIRRPRSVGWRWTNSIWRILLIRRNLGEGGSEA